MADVPGVAGRSGDHPTADDEPAADAGGDYHPHHVVDALRRAYPVLRHGDGDAVHLERHGQVEAALDEH